MRKLGLTEMNAFVAVAQHLSFAKAAGHLGISRPSLSETIRGLEDRLGVRLLNRTTRSVSLTQAGDRLLRRLQPILDDISGALDSINSFRDKPAGLLRLTVAPPAVKMVIEPVMGPFLAAYPDIQLEISSDGAIVDIVRQNFNAGIRIGTKIDRDMIAIPLSQAAVPVLVASPAYLKRRGTPQRIEDLTAHNCIRIRLPSGAFIPWHFLRDGKAVEVAVEGAFVGNTSELQLTAALEGIGLAQVLEDEATELIARKKLVRVMQPLERAGAEFSLYYPSRRQVPLVLQSFIDFLRKERLLVGARRA